MGKLLEWPTVITEGDDLEDCRDLLVEAATEMAELYKDEGMNIPYPSIVVETVNIPVKEEAMLVNVG
ncbi:MAG: type II toxin-antitoxin system HicB family antitoxin [Synergistaceae bacterium]|nr:type II toxin-antitoxin system HicB family antitoxin [Synergistaceae bacterium]MBQ3450058.1 type II toxin-antitoxin system HicB family antitoxin [Synergistaceae bacterium]MBQ3695084.1 type II toxin-antitoxin system HicB family antitoxin [Synergistaceae bacterium]MBQ6112549.1 type II toxin-antitoxin system HicB family antitoxin [Synergistaceae bacterium]MBQ9629773.1 type II toxin-antitoxin system HicB family antitoxin [Synergistaceae bacterium]